jgi:sulfoxide reductase catalytic subunit YedY
MLIKQAPDIRSSEITPERLYCNRRQFIHAASGAALGAAGAAVLGQPDGGLQAAPQEDLADLRPSQFSTDERQNSYEEITSYNNFYEFGLDKEDPKRYADDLTVKPWTVRVEGHMNRPAADYTLEDILSPHTLEERIYRLRCVEGWSMVIPWAGFPLAELISAAEPTSKAKFVHFVTLYSKEQFPAHKNNAYLPWPYEEALRMDEAMNELTLMAAGMYGQELANTNGAPLRVLVPWKYGFKSIKSIVSIELTEEQPKATWNQANPRYYGWYSNVNPRVNPVPYSQATETRIGENRRRRTELFNGYEEHVAHLYEDLDLRRNY